MNHRSFGVLATIAFALPMLLGACCPANPAPAASAAAATARTKVDRTSRVLTVPHDGHQFVIARATEAVAIVHHPACPCLSR